MFAATSKDENTQDADYRILKFPEFKVPFIGEEEEALDIRALPFGLVKKYILPKNNMQTFANLHKLRLYTIHWWDLVTNEMIALAKRTFTRVAHFNEAMLIEALFCYNELHFNKKYVEDTLLKHGSFQGLKLDNQRRKEYADKRKAKKEEAKKEKIQKQSETKAKINQVFIQLGYNPLKEWRSKLHYDNDIKSTLNGWIRANYVPSKQEVEKEMEKTCLQMIEKREFNELFLVVGKEKFKKWVVTTL